MQECSQEDSVTSITAHSYSTDRSFYCTLFLIYYEQMFYKQLEHGFLLFSTIYTSTLSATGVVSSRSTALQHLNS